MSKRRLISIVLGVIVALIAGYLKKEGGGSTIAFDGLTLSEVPATVAGGDWTHLKKCRLITGRNNDGDSFHVKHEEGETEFRLYFVDTPESKYKTYRGGDSNGKRIGEQGKYFGGLDREETTAVGSDAKKLVAEILTQGEFEIFTRWEEVYGPDRRYALVVPKVKGQRFFLHELLVGKGLGRIHTTGVDIPQLRKRREQESVLRDLEKDAQAANVGGWVN